MRSFCTIDSSDAGVGWRLAGLFLWVSFYQIVAENEREVWQDWSMGRRGWEGRIWAWLSEGYRAPLAWWGWGWVREAIKIKLNPFLFPSGGWVPDAIWWPGFSAELCVPPLMDHEYLNPAFRGQTWCSYFSYSCDNLALQCKISGVRITLAEYRMSRANSGGCTGRL